MSSRNRIAGMTLPEIRRFLDSRKRELPYGYRLPYMQWYEENFVGSSGVRDMHYIEEWIYRQLLAKAWVSKNSPYLPNDEQTLRRLSGCKDQKLWRKYSPAVLQMFEKTETGEELFHPRQLIDYAIQVSKIAANIENASKKPKSLFTNDGGGAIATQSLTERTAVATQSLSHKELELELEVKQELESEQDPTLGETTDMKADKQISMLCERVFSKKANLYSRNLTRIKELEFLHKGSSVVRAFGEWSLAHQDDFDLKDPVSSFLLEADDILCGNAPFQRAQKNPAVLDLLLGFAKIDNRVNFGDREKTRLQEHLKEFTADELTTGFRNWLETQDFSLPKILQYAAKNFSEVADQKAHYVRASRLDRDKTQAARDAKALQMQEEAEAERKKAEAERAEQESFDPLADLA